MDLIVGQTRPSLIASLGVLFLCIGVIVPQVHGAGGATAGGSGSPGTIVGVAIGEPILPADVAIDASGDLLITELAGEPGGQIRKVAPDGSLTNVAAAGPLATSFGFGGDGGPALDAAINGAGGLTVDGKGNILFADSGNQRIRRISRDGIITTVAGSGPPDIGGFSGDGGLATDARLNHPSDVAVDAAGNLYIADLGNRRIRKVSPDGIISTFAGNGATITDAYGTVVGALTGDGGSATGAAFAYPSHVAVDGAGNVYVSDGEIGAMYPSPPYYPYVVGNNRVRKIDRNGVITTIAGIGDSAGSPGIRPLVEGGSATETALGELPGSLVVDTEGNVYVAVQASYRVRRISPDGLVSTVVGSGPSGTDRYGFPIGSPDGDGALATQAHLGFVNGLALDKDGNLFTAERATTSSEGRLRKVFAVAAPGLLAGRPFPGSPALVGDVDGNGQVEVRDALLALRGAVGIALLSAPEQAAADVNGDGQMDLRDVTLILRKAIGL